MDAEKVLIVMSSGPSTHRRCATPFHFATLAAAMDYEVTMFFTIDGTLLLVKGTAEAIYPKEGGQAVSEFLALARDSGVHLVACPASLELHNLRREDLLPEVSLMGGAGMWELAAEARTVLSF